MAHISKAIEKLKSALRKTARILSSDLRPICEPGRRINEEFLTEFEKRLVAGEMNAALIKLIITTIRDRWLLGKIMYAEQCLSIVREVLGQQN